MVAVVVVAVVVVAVVMSATIPVVVLFRRRRRHQHLLLGLIFLHQFLQRLGPTAARPTAGAHVRRPDGGRLRWGGLL